MSKIPITPDIIGEPLCIFCSYRCNRGIIAGKPKITFNCPYCCSVFSNTNALNQHIMTHTKERPHKCIRCEYRTYAERSLLEHMKDKHLMCASCNPFQAFDTKSQFDTHWKDRHGIVNKKERKNKNLNKSTDETATKSGKNFENKTTATEKPPVIIIGTNQSHEQKVVNQDNNFTSVNTVQEQPSTSENDDMNLCTLCKYNCNRGIVCDYPDIISNEFTFDCFYCCSRFLQRKEMQYHINKTHTKETPYKCEDCDYRTPNPFILETHHTRENHMKGYLSNKAFLKTQDSSTFYFQQFPRKRKRTFQKSTLSRIS